MYFENLNLKTLIYQREGIKYKEEWKDIPEFEGVFQISNLGRVKSLTRHVNTYRKGRTVKSIIRKQKKHPSGYLYIGLRKNNHNYTFKVHRLVAKAFVPNPENKPEVNHKKGIKIDNRYFELEWNTSKENSKHKIENGLYTSVKGIDHYCAKLTEQDVLEIREIGSSKTQRELSKKYNIHHSKISSILNRKSWSHI